MKDSKKISVVFAAALIAIFSFQVKSQITIFDDSFGADWKSGSWNLYVDLETTYDNSCASLNRIGGVKISTSDSSGIDISPNSILSLYINFVPTETLTGYSFTNVKVSTVDGTLFEFDDRSTGWAYTLDGIEYSDSAEVFFDTDPFTWQLFEIDLSQVDYFGWPYQSRNIGSTPITSINFSPYGNTTGDINMYADNIMLYPASVTIPEPSAIILALIGACSAFSKIKRKI